MKIVQRAAALLGLLFALANGQVAADSNPLPAPQGTPILTMTGAIANTNAAGTAAFDAAMIAALPHHEVTTSTPWYDQPRTFAGPLLRDVLAAAGANGNTLRVAALNDYAVDVPVADVLDYDVLLADRIDGQPIPVRERGPLFIIYPFDQVPALKSEKFYQRCVWQVKSIEVGP